jgi:hypothetical protein
VPRDPEEKVIGHLAPVAEHHVLPLGVEALHQPVGVPGDVTVGEGDE